MRFPGHYFVGYIIRSWFFNSIIGLDGQLIPKFFNPLIISNVIDRTIEYRPRHVYLLEPEEILDFSMIGKKKELFDLFYYLV